MHKRELERDRFDVADVAQHFVFEREKAINPEGKIFLDMQCSPDHSQIAVYLGGHFSEAKCITSQEK